MKIAIERIKKWEADGNDWKVLDLSNLELEELPELPDNLIKLNCSRNRLTFFNTELPSELEYVDCSYNLMTAIPIMPINCRYIDCSHNRIETIPELPMVCEYFDCSHNRLSVLPVLPDSLIYINFLDNYMENTPDESILSLPNIKVINKTEVIIKPYVIEKKRIMYDNIPVPRKRIGACLYNDKYYEVEDYLAKSKDNIVTGYNNFYNCCKRSKMVNKSDAILLNGIKHYKLNCVDKYASVIDVYKIESGKFVIFNLIDSEAEGVVKINGYTLDDYTKV